VLVDLPCETLGPSLAIAKIAAALTARAGPALIGRMALLFCCCFIRALRGGAFVKAGGPKHKEIQVEYSE
jgi:hypothetical protein